MRMSLEKLRQHRAKPTPAHGCRQCKAQSTADFAGALGRLLLRFIHRLDGRAQTLLQLGTCFSHSNLAGGAFHEPNAEAFLHGGEAFRDDCRVSLQ
ncbi:hypothetical protein D3C79_981460 [compost metagenome]